MHVRRVRYLPKNGSDALAAAAASALLNSTHRSTVRSVMRRTSLFSVVLACWVLTQVSCDALSLGPAALRPLVSPSMKPRTEGPLLVATAGAAVADSEQPPPPAVPLLMAIAGLQSACFGCIGTALPPALRAAGLDPGSVALLLGRLGSASALLEVLLSNTFGKLSDAIGRKPIMLAAPALTVLARGMVIFRPTLPVLIGARCLTTLVVPIYWLAYQAAMADAFAGNTTKLAITGSRVQAGMGLGYAIASLLGGRLAQIDIRYACERPAHPWKLAPAVVAATARARARTHRRIGHVALSRPFRCAPRPPPPRALLLPALTLHPRWLCAPPLYCRPRRGVLHAGMRRHRPHRSRDSRDAHAVAPRPIPLGERIPYWVRRPLPTRLSLDEAQPRHRLPEPR